MRPIGFGAALLAFAAHGVAEADSTPHDEGLYASLSGGFSGIFGSLFEEEELGMATLRGGPGVTSRIGWAVGPRFGIDVFGHFGTIEMVYEGGQPGELYLVGAELRRIVAAEGTLKGWGSVGLAFGGATLHAETRYEGVLQDTWEFSASFLGMPSIALGVEGRMLSTLRVGLQVQWAFLWARRECVRSDRFPSESGCRAKTDLDSEVVLLEIALAFSARERGSPRASNPASQ